MAKVAKPVKEKLYPSEYGSHSSMIDAEETAKLPPITERFIPNDYGKSLGLIESESVEMVVCRDQFGCYLTEKWRIDNNMADPNRNAGSRIVIN